eukprot:TRINITY_DN36331_c0_g1_i1.p1 TRINITY_DN36331_c0_g1~~TRINITY_DN36331_c0_g1_i1.p1  ORF type:complete len:533 (-),score=80.04 TRINITY_DN36331_c0_g1_i1:141-1739(-)
MASAVHERVVQAVFRQYECMPGRGKPQGRSWTVLAGLVAEVPGEEDLRVLALATGTRCVGVAAMTAGHGQVVHDCHAEVLCRRAFHRYLLAEILHSAPDTSVAGIERSLLQRLPAAEGNEEEVCFALKPGVRLHFYVSALPCGECALVPISNSHEGTLARKWLRREQGEPAEQAPLRDRNRTGAKPSMGMPMDPQDDGIGFHRNGVLRYKSGRSDTRPECRTVCYSCSEKICRWNHTGWQGALLSRVFNEPLRMHSIVIGGPIYDGDFVRLALFGRGASLSASSSACPEFFHTTLPFPASREAMEGMESTAHYNKVSTAGLSLVWSAPAPGSAAGVSEGRPPPPPERSISRTVRGFYDIIIGHKGQRQGLRNDREDAKKPGGSTETASSWVSPLCKQFMAQDTLQTLAVVLGSEEALARWLLKGSKRIELDDDSARASKRQRLNDGSCSTQESEEDFFARRPSYCWLKEVMACGTLYRRCRQHFHSADPFLHWRRKHTLAFDGSPDGVDGFAVSLPEAEPVSELLEAVPLAR